MTTITATTGWIPAGALCAALAVTLVADSSAGSPVRSETVGATEPSTSFALRAAKVLTATMDGPGYVDDGLVVVRNGRIEAVGAARDLAPPDGLDVIDLGDRWLMPGLVDLHSHVGGTFDINDMVYQVNPGLRVSSAVVPGNESLDRALAGGVTTVLFIPGSGTNIGGQGILLKTGLDTFEAMKIREPGSLKIAQGDNPTRWAYGMGRSLMAYHIRSTLRKGRAYFEAWRAHEEGGAEPPNVNLHLEVFRHLFGKTTQVSTHTQYYQLVLTSITLMAGEFGLDTYIDHGTFDGYRTAPLAEELGVAAIIGPRQVSYDRSRYPNDLDGSVVGCAGEYQTRGSTMVGFNTDAPVVPQEELFLQSAMGVRYGFDNSALGAVRGVTIVPATVAGIGDRVGSIEPGKDADLVVISGDPSDPRSAVERVFIEGHCVYDVANGRRVF